MKRVRNPVRPEQGWRTHPQFPSNFPTVIGWTQKAEAPNPKTTVGLQSATPQAIARWEAKRWPTNVTFFEDKLLMRPAVDGAFVGAGG